MLTLFLARRFPDSGLLPVCDAEAEARILSLMSCLASTVHPARRQGIEHARRIWVFAEARLTGWPWAERAAMSIADIDLFRLFWRFRGSAALARGEFPGLQDHHRRMMSRPAVRRSCEVEAGIGYELAA